MISSSSRPAPLLLDELDRSGVVRRSRTELRAPSGPAEDTRRQKLSEATQRAIGEAARQGWDAGHEEGRAAGYERGMNEAQTKMQATLAGLAAAAADIRVRAATDLADAEEAIVSAALDLASLILGREVAAAHDPGREAIVRALALAPPGPVVVRMRPADLDRLDESAVNGERELTILPDPDIEAGGCVVEAGATRIDAQLSSALARARAFLLDGGAA